MKRQRLVLERKKRNLSATELAKAINISKPMLSHIEHGRHNPSWDVQQRLEQFFGIPISELLAETEDSEDSPSFTLIKH